VKIIQKMAKYNNWNPVNSNEYYEKINRRYINDDKEEELTEEQKNEYFDIISSLNNRVYTTRTIGYHTSSLTITVQLLNQQLLVIVIVVIVVTVAVAVAVVVVVVAVAVTFIQNIN